MDKLLSMRPRLSRPMLWAALFCLAGLIMQCLGLSSAAAIAILAVSAAALLAVTKKSLIPLLLALALSVLMTARFAHVRGLAEAVAEKYDGMETLLTGRLYTEPVYSANSCTAELDTGLGRIRLVCYDGDITGEIGDTVTANVVLSAPDIPGNDYGFNDREYLYSRGIYLTAEADGMPKVTAAKSRGIRWAASKIRGYAISMGEKRLGGKALELYCAIVFGDRSRLNPDLKTALSISGLSHISAVSGMHLSVVAVIIMFLLSMIFGKRRFARLLTIPAMALFALVTGGEPSVVRACIMNVIFQLSIVLYRENDSLSALSLAFMIMCGFKPMLVYSAGFRLSAAATLGIILFAEIFKRPFKLLTSGEVFKGGLPMRVLGRIIYGAGGVIAVSLSAQAGVFPVLLYYFRYISAYALLSNLIVVPLLTPIMVFGLLLALLGPLPFIGGLPALICGPLLEFVAFSAEKISALPGAAIPVARPDIFMTLAYIAAVLAFFAFVKKYKITGAVLTVTFIAALVLSGIRVYRQSGVPELCFINTGRGDCALFRLSDGTTVLVDGGKGSAPEDYLSARGIFSLDCAVLTSAKLEHISGLITLVDNGFVKTLYVPSFISGDRLNTLLLSADEAGTRVIEYGEGGSVYAGGLTLTAFDSDGESAQLLAEYQGTKVLFCGDGVMDWADCDIVKMPSHGAGNYNYYPELHRHRPKYAVVTAAGEYAFENSKSSAVLRDMKVPCYVPAMDGTVTFALGKDLSVTTTREKYNGL